MSEFSKEELEIPPVKYECKWLSIILSTVSVVYLCQHYEIKTILCELEDNKYFTH